MKTLTIKDETWQHLTILKAKTMSESLDDVIQYLIDNQVTDKQKKGDANG